LLDQLLSRRITPRNDDLEKPMNVSPSLATAPRELAYFLMLNPGEQAAAVRRMAALGWGDYTIAAATRLSVDYVRRQFGDASPRTAASSRAGAR
jgi:hypothetical protein